MIRVNQ